MSDQIPEDAWVKDVVPAPAFDWGKLIRDILLALAVALGGLSQTGVQVCKPAAKCPCGDACTCCPAACTDKHP